MNNFWLLVAGALLAIVGGAVGDEIRAWRVRERKRNAIKISLADELRGIEAIMGNMHEVWNSTQVFAPSYVSDLLAGTSAYDSLRLDLYLIKDGALRKEIGDFYKKLKDEARKTEGRLGTLSADESARNEQAAFDTAFQTLCTEARTLRQKLE